MKIKNLIKSYDEKQLFNGFDMEFADKKINVVMGPSGVGKTTLLNCIAGILPFEGEIDFDGRVSYIFQNERLIPQISVYKNLDMILKADVKDRAERQKAIREMIEALEISEYEKKPVRELSGGERQRVAMARAYLYKSEVMLLDEPFKALDAALKTRLISQLTALNEKRPHTVIFVTHEIEECLLTADKYFVLSGSPVKCVLSGDIDEKKSERSLFDEKLTEERAKLVHALYE